MFLPYARQSIDESDLKAVQEALKEDLITRGPPVAEFEKAIAEFCGARFAVAFSSGTTALMGAFFAAGTSPYDQVYSSPNTYIASVGIPVQMGIRPRLVDIDRSNGNIDLELLEKELETPFSRGKPIIVPVHFSGIAVDMRKLDKMIKHPDAVVIEDAAHAIGSAYPSGEKVGSCAYSQMTIFSFHPAKTITAGEGGMVTTNDENLYHRLQLYRDNGIERAAPHLQQPSALGYYEVSAITGNFNLTSFQAALGLSQFKRLDKFVDQRRKLIKKYRSLLIDVTHIQLFSEEYDERSAYHLFVVQIDFAAYRTTRENVMRALKERGVGTQVHYIPLYRHPVLKMLDDYSEFPKAEQYYARALSLPLYYDLTENDVERVCQELINLLRI